MGTKLYVGNLSFNTTETDLQDLFAQAGAVSEVTLMQDKFTGKSRGFAFVTMTNEADAQKAITDFNGKTVEGRPLTVNEARPREARPGGGGGGGGRGGYGGGGGGYGGGGYGWRRWRWRLRRRWWRRTSPTAVAASVADANRSPTIFSKSAGKPRRLFCFQPRSPKKRQFVAKKSCHRRGIRHRWPVCRRTSRIFRGIIR